MPNHQPTDTQVITGREAAPLPWDDVSARLADPLTYWFATVHPDGRPHVRPVFAVWVDGAMHTTSNPDAGKAHNLADNDRCSLSVTADGMDIAYEGVARPVTDHAHLERIRDAYADKYGWPVTIEGTAFDAPYGAPTAGPPPYQPYRIVPTTVFAFATEDGLHDRGTRFRF